MTDEPVTELLASWALDALDDQARQRVEAALAHDPALVDAAAELQHVVALLGEGMATPPPAAQRPALLRAAAARPRRGVEPSPPVEALAAQVDALAGLLGGLGPGDWRRPAAPYTWDVHGLVAHLLVIERYTAGQLGVPGAPVLDGGHHLRMGADEIAAEVAGDPQATAAAWADAARRTVAAARAGQARTAGEAVELHGWPFTAAAVLVLRTFELWTHADDIRRAVGRPLEAPPAGDLRTMASFSVASLPALLPIAAPEATPAPARVVLTGPGGATFDLLADLAGPAELGDHTGRDVEAAPAPAATLVADVVDYCRLATRRVQPDEVDVVIEGDQALGRALLAAARVLAV